jgi:hypothetical protein
MEIMNRKLYIITAQSVITGSREHPQSVMTKCYVENSNGKTMIPFARSMATKVTPKEAISIVNKMKEEWKGLIHWKLTRAIEDIS